MESRMAPHSRKGCLEGRGQGQCPGSQGARSQPQHAPACPPRGQGGASAGPAPAPPPTHTPWGPAPINCWDLGCGALREYASCGQLAPKGKVVLRKLAPSLEPLSQVIHSSPDRGEDPSSSEVPLAQLHTAWKQEWSLPRQGGRPLSSACSPSPPHTSSDPLLLSEPSHGDWPSRVPGPGPALGHCEVTPHTAPQAERRSEVGGVGRRWQDLLPPCFPSESASPPFGGMMGHGGQIPLPQLQAALDFLLLN